MLTEMALIAAECFTSFEKAENGITVYNPKVTAPLPSWENHASKNYKQGNNYMLYNADCVEVARNMDDNSVDFIIYSPPFSSLYTYSNDERDMGNCKTDDEFLSILAFLLKCIECLRLAG